MDSKVKRRSHLHQNLVLFALFALLCKTTAAKPADQNQTSEILVKRLSTSNTNGELVPKLYKLTQDGHQEEIPSSSFTMKSNTVNVQSDFKTVNISVLNKQKEEENAKKEAIVQEDLQSRLKVTETESSPVESLKKESQSESVDSMEVTKKQDGTKENTESRLFSDDGFSGYHDSDYQADTYHQPSKRSEDDYYTDDTPGKPSFKPTPVPPTKEEDESFFSIFESLFGSSDDESETTKKAETEEDEFKFKDPEDASIKENIKTVGDILKPLKPVEEPESKSKSAYSVYQSDAPEYRIVNNFHLSQTQKQGFKPPHSHPTYHSSYRPVTEHTFQPYKTHSTSGYEDYDLEEFLDKSDTATQVKYVPPVTTFVRKDPVTVPSNPTIPTTTTTKKLFTTTSTTTTTTTTTRPTTKNLFENKVKFPSVQKKNDYINKNRYQEIKNDMTEKPTEKGTEKTTYRLPEVKTTTEKHYNYNQLSKLNEINSPKVQESPNFYNLINLPVKYSTKDTAIPLISTSYANTKIQGMGAHKYEKGSNGKYPNHKYEHTSVVTTQKPSYWATKRTESSIKASEGTTDKYSSAISGSKATTNYVSSKDYEKLEYDAMQMGMGPAFGGYGAKKGTDTKAETQLTSSTLTTTFQKETTTQRNTNTKTTDKKEESHIMRPNAESKKTVTKEDGDGVMTDDYDYDIIPARVEELKPNNQNYPPQVIYGQAGQHKNEVELNKNEGNGYKDTYLPGPDSEISEYEYYDYDFDTTPSPQLTTTSTTTTTTTTTKTTTTPATKISVKYPNLPKEALKAEPSGEKVAVVMATKDHSLYTETSKPPTIIMSSAETTHSSPTTIKTTTTTTTTTTTPRPTPTTISTTKRINAEYTSHFKQSTDPRPSFFPKESSPVFENKLEQHQPKQQQTTKLVYTSPTRTTSSDKPSTEPTPHAIVVTSTTKQKQDHQAEQESNVNIVLVPTKETIKPSEKPEEKYTKTDRPTNTPTNAYIHTSYEKVNGLHYPGYTGYTTEFTVGAVHGHGGNAVFQNGLNKPNVHGHFVASSIPTNPYGNDEPFRPIPKPAGMTASFQVVRDDDPVQHLQTKSPGSFQSNRPLSLSTNTGDRPREPVHVPHEFIPSPQFHRPVGPKPATGLRPQDVDYELEGIQTQPKPGQYVIFSKPQLNPEVNENQLKKKPEISAPKPNVSNAPHFQDNGNLYSQESQEHVIFNPKEGQFYHSGPSKKPFVPEKPVYSSLPTNTEDGLPLGLVPPKGTQTEKPFDRNFVTPESDKESTVSYPRPHWEKNGKPSFLYSTIPNKNDPNRPQPVPNQMSHTLMPPNNAPPQRFRRPQMPPPNATPSRKNFNEAATNIKPKPNLPNILPQFRPNTKVGSGPYHRPNVYSSPNRRNGMNRYPENEHGNFPYHIQYPDKEGPPPGNYEMAPEIVPKFITNRGKLPSDLWNNGVQKRFGQTPPNPQLKLSSSPYPPQGPKVLKRLQRTPVTTLQMLKQMPGVKAQKMPIIREGTGTPPDSLMPPVYRTFADEPKTEENLYIVYPAKASQKLVPDNGKVFIVSDTKSQKKSANLTSDEQVPLLNPGKRVNPTADKTNFPYGFIKSDGQGKSNKNENRDKAPNTPKENESKLPNYILSPESNPNKEYENIDMNLHMQSNNQWNEVRTSHMESILKESAQESSLGSQYRYSGDKSDSKKTKIQANPPSEYRTSIREDGKDSSFTLGAVMHTVSDANRKGPVPSVPSHNTENQPSLPQLSVNERISNGKIITVSMPLDVKEDKESNRVPESQGFQAPFQASSSVDFAENQGWTVVKGPENKDEEEEENETTESSTTRFNFENFKPELIGGFKPIFETPEEPKESKSSEKEAEMKTES